MNDPITRNINSSVQKTYEWLVDMERELHTGDRQIAYHALRSVLHALRDRLPVGEAVDLAAELPMLLRGLYYEGWQPTHKPEKLNREEFLNKIAANYGAPSTPDPLRFTRAVLSVLEMRVASGEMSDVRLALPKDIQELWPSLRKS